MSLAYNLGEGESNMVELPKTEDELNTLIESKVNAKVEELTSKHNGEMANLRKSYEDKISSILDEITVPTEDWSN